VIFVDSSFWIALAVPRDGRHDTAQALLRAHADDELVTSNHVRGETWTFLRSRLGHFKAVSFLEFLAGSAVTDVAFVAEEVEREALLWLGRHDERAYSFVDATSFALMRRRGLHEALAFDGDFAAAGFVELRV
jgi:predicted nucleic acid-binding protein